MNDVNVPGGVQAVPAVPEMNDEPWQAVSPRYVHVLRMAVLGNALFLAAILLAVFWVRAFPEGGNLILAGCLALLACGTVAMLVFWAPRRVRFTRFLLRALDMNLRTGLWWRKTVSVAINRIQHMTITQGPVERLLGLSCLTLYTAGGASADLTLPGLESETAQHLKAQLLLQISNENEEPG